MHELAATKELMKLVIKECRKKKTLLPKKIAKVVVELGELTTYKKEPLKLYYDLLKKDDPSLAKSTLKVNLMKGKILCKACNKISQIKEVYMLFCPRCRSSDVKFIRGREFKVKEIIFYN